MAFAPTIDLIFYGFSSGEANRIIMALKNPIFERGELLRRLKNLERTRKLSNGYTTNLSRAEVMAFVASLPSLLLDRSARAYSRPHPLMTDDDRDEMSLRARSLIASVNSMADRTKLLRVTGREWQKNRGLHLQRDVGLEFC